MKIATILLFLFCWRVNSQIAMSYFDQSFLNAANPRSSGPTTAPTYGSSGSTGAGTATTLTISAFTVSGSTPYLLVAEFNDSSLTARTCTGITANGIAMTSLINTNFRSHGNCYVFGLANPTSGDIVATLSGSANNGATMMAVLLNGAGTAGPVGATFLVSASTSMSAVVSGTVSTDLVIDFLGGSQSWTPGGSQTLRLQAALGVAGQSSTIAGSAGSTTMSESGSSTTVSLLAVAIHGL